MTVRDRLTGGPPAWRTRRGRAVLRLAQHRRLVAVALLALAVVLPVAGLRRPVRDTVPVRVAARNLNGGARLTRGDVTTARLPPDAVPDGAVRTRAVGRVLAAPMRRGEPFTDVRLLGPNLLAGYRSGTVAAPVRIADAGSVRLLHAGDRIDVLAAGKDTVAAAGRTVASGVPVLAVPHASGSGLGSRGALVVVATSPGVAARLARFAVSARLSVTIRPS